ncbi:MAG: indolepyruvate ferredoxin oxidoreductase subunit alpha [Thermodesulfobacteriota bacterium]|jgi:indolepyruvate ferredoxin oxidoreductase alpha subunit|nr:MAG: indolepyruvate ferredoxin oxidoreductase subunit alpha [Thermodesulfobacteriota bacterium]
MKTLMLGNEAVARGAYEAGVTVATAYPGTPSTEITENIAKYDEIYCEWSPNEKVALEVALGASIAGARSICSMKHVGLNVAADPLFTSSYTGINGGLVVVVGDDSGMHSSQNEQDSRFYARASNVPMLEPSDSRECKEFIIKAFEISEKYDSPVLVRLSTRISHSRSIVDKGGRCDYNLKKYKKDFNKYVMLPAMARKRHVEVEKRMVQLREYSNSIEINKVEWGSKDIGVVTSGIAYQYAREAFGDVSYLKLGMVYPLPEKLIRDFAKEVGKLYIVEELEPFLEDYIRSFGVHAIGKELLPVLGELSASIIKEKVLNIRTGPNKSINGEVPVRPPVMCPGCPHRGVFYVLKKLKLTVSGDIGCYTLGALPPNESIDTCICMGSSVSVAHGMEKARGRKFGKKTVGIVGDSTFIHSGITGLIDIAYNKGNSTIIILDNFTTGMTGHQHNPATGYTIKNEPTRKVDLVKLANAVGIDRVRIVDPFDLKKLEEVVKEETSVDASSVIIARRPCAMLKPVSFDGPIRIIFDKCKNCNKLCLSVGCPAITDMGEYLEINEEICVGCGLCAKVCNNDAIEKAGRDNA